MRHKIERGRDLLTDTLTSLLEHSGLRIISVKAFFTYALHLVQAVYSLSYTDLHFSLLMCGIVFSLFHLDYSTPDLP